MTKIYEVLDRATHLLVPSWTYESQVMRLDYNERVRGKIGHRFICHAVMQAWQELHAEAVVWPYSWTSWRHNNPACRFLRDLGMPAQIDWEGAEPYKNQEVRFMFLEFAYLLALEEDL